MKSLKQLERAALAAHGRGESWLSFWPSVSADVGALEPWSAARHRKLAARLLSLVVSGDCPRQLDGGDPAPWMRDDAKPADTGTAARLQVRLPPT